MTTVQNPDDVLAAMYARDPSIEDEHLAEYMFTRNFSNDPYPFYAYLREVKPVWFCERMNGWVISRFDDVGAALKDDAVYTTKNYEWQLSNIHGRNMLDMSGKEHSTKRGLMTPFFHGKGLARLEGLISSTSAEMVREFAADGEVELYSQYSKLFPMRVITRLMGIDDEESLDMDQLIAWFNAMIRQTANLTGNEQILTEALEARAAFDEFIVPIIERRRAEPRREDLLSFLVDAEIDGVRLTDEEIRANSSLLLSAGWETTDKLILSTMTRLVSDRKALAAAQADRSLVQMAVAETLRRDGVLQMLARQLAEDVEIRGQRIPADETVLILVASANRDPDAFSEPDRFNIWRDDLDANRAFTAGGRQLTFGAGRHFCLGAQLGRVEAVTALNHFLDVMDDPEFRDGVEPAWEGLFFRSEGALESIFRAVRKLDLTFSPTGKAV